MWPFYTGGADAAVRNGAEAQVALAQAARSGAASLSQLDLARAYFGQQAALQLLATDEAQLTALQAHAHNAERMVAAGCCRARACWRWAWRATLPSAA